MTWSVTGGQQGASSRHDFHFIHGLAQPVSVIRVQYQAASWHRPRRVIARVEHHLRELFPRVGFIVTTLTGRNRAVARFHNQRGTVEQWIQEGKAATPWSRLSCHPFRTNEVRLLLGVITYNLGHLLWIPYMARLATGPAARYRLESRLSRLPPVRHMAGVLAVEARRSGAAPQ